MPGETSLDDVSTCVRIGRMVLSGIIWRRVMDSSGVTERRKVCVASASPKDWSEASGPDTC